MELQKSRVVPFPAFAAEGTIGEFIQLADSGKSLGLSDLRDFASTLVAYARGSIVGLMGQLEALPRCSDGKCRQSSLLYHSPSISAYLLEWPKDHPGTEIHDHGDSSAAVCVLRGAVRETVFSTEGGRFPSPEIRIRRNSLQVYAPNSPEVCADCKEDEEGNFVPIVLNHPYVHSFACEGSECDRAVSLHIYSPGLTAMKFYAFGARGLSVIGGWNYDGSPFNICGCGRRKDGAP